MAKKYYTFDELPAHVQAQVIERQKTCSHPLWCLPQTHLINAQGHFGSSGEKGHVENQVCTECGVSKGTYYAHAFGRGVPYLLRQGESLVTLGLVKLGDE